MSKATKDSPRGELHPVYPVRTARLRLRPLTMADAPALLSYRGDAEVCRFLPFEPMDETVLSRRLAADLGRREITAEGQALTLGAELLGSGRLIGDVVLFFHSAEDALGEIGYVFHPEVAGRGYASEACAAMLDLAFDELGLRRVTALMDARNHASARLVARLGMREQSRGREMFKGTMADHVVYALDATAWEALRGAPGGGEASLKPD